MNDYRLAGDSIATVLLGVVAIVAVLLLRLAANSRDGESATRTSVTVLVLGDIGRSPRMQYHSISLAKHGAGVNLVGFTESALHPDIISNRSIKVVPLSPPVSLLREAPRALFLLTGPMKVIWQSLNLLWVLLFVVNPTKWMLVQNPPSIPVLAIAQVVCLLRRTRLVIDWHNLGWSVLALRLGPSHLFVRVSKWYEATLARFTTYHFAVTEAMCRMLRREFGIAALPLHDRPMGAFQPLSVGARREFLAQLPSELPAIAPFVQELQSEDRRLRLIVSSTSWTPDEDFSILLEALKAYSNLAAQTSRLLPKILAVITGKGPQKSLYMPLINTINKDSNSNVFILTAWLSNQSYASILGAADLGVSLHISTSGVDLPMKVVDMLGAGLPVLGWSDYEAWPELITEGKNGMGFKTSAQLSTLMRKFFDDGGRTLSTLKEGALEDGNRRWDDEWDTVAAELFELKT